LNIDPTVGRAVITELEILENSGYITATHLPYKKSFEWKFKAFTSCAAVIPRE
jgi:hypothetical protein